MNHLQEHDTWGVIDPSKMQSYMDCARHYFFEYILGWRREEPNVHLVYGTAAHLALEHLLLNGYDADSIMEAYYLFEAEYRKVFPEEMDDINSPKIPANFLFALPEYANMYKHEDAQAEVLATEIAGTVYIGDDKPMRFRMDSIIKDHLGIHSLEHKTVGRGITSAWTNQWRQKMQVGTYSHVLYCMYEEDEVFGVVMNALCIKNPPKRANAKGNEYMRIPIRKSIRQMEDWLATANFWYDSIVRDTDAVTHVSEDDPVMKCFPKNTESCSKYFGCPFMNYCEAWSNPIQHLGNMPAGFNVDFWDPRTLEENAKKKVSL